MRTQSDLAEATLDSLHHCIAVINRDGEIVSVNEAWKRFATDNGGNLHHCGIGANYLDVCRCDEADDSYLNETGAKATRVANTGVADTCVARHVHDSLHQMITGTLREFSAEYSCHSKEEQRWFSLEAKQVEASDGCIAIIHSNITKRKLAEFALREREGEVQAILDTVTDSIITIDRKGIMLSANRATERMFGYDINDLIGRNVSILMPQPFRGYHDRYINRYLETNDARIIGKGREVRAIHRDGTTFPVDLAVSEMDSLGRFTGIIRDISERKELQKAVLEIAAAEQRRIGQDLHDGTQQELAGLSLYAGAALNHLETAVPNSESSPQTWELTDDRYKRVHETLTCMTETLSQSIANVHELSHGIMPVQVDSQGLTMALQSLVAQSIFSDQVTCSFHHDLGEDAPNNMVATQLYRIAQEALGNALRHSRGDKITISLSKTDESFVMRVCDNGAGIDATTSVRPAGEEGMGLNIMEYRASSVGGTLHVQKNEHGGTTIQCEVPIE